MSPMAELQDKTSEPVLLDIAPQREPDDAGDVAAPTAESEPMGPQVTISSRAARWGRLASDVVASVGLHAAIAAFFLLGPGQHLGSVLLSGLKHAGVSANGDAPVDSRRGQKSAPQPDAISVTLTPPPEEKASKQAEKTPPAVKPVPAAPPTPPRPTPPQPAPRPHRQQIVAAKAPAHSAVEKVVRPPEPATKPAPPPPQQQSQTKPVQPAAEKPTTTPQKPRPPTNPALTFRQPFLLPGSGAIDRRGGLLTAHRADEKSQASNSTGSAKKSSGDSATSNYPGRVARKLNKSLQYPPGRAAAKLRGEATVSFVVDANGKARDIAIVHSSGSDVLDAAAVKSVQRASPFPPIPASTGRGEWPFTVTLAFGK